MDQVLLQEGVPPVTVVRVQGQGQPIAHLQEAPHQEGAAVIVVEALQAAVPAGLQAVALAVVQAEAVVPETEDKQLQITKY